MKVYDGKEDLINKYVVGGYSLLSLDDVLIVLKNPKDFIKNKIVSGIKGSQIKREIEEYILAWRIRDPLGKSFSSIEENDLRETISRMLA